MMVDKTKPQTNEAIERLLDALLFETKPLPSEAIKRLLDELFEPPEFVITADWVGGMVQKALLEEKAEGRRSGERMERFVDNVARYLTLENACTQTVIDGSVDEKCTYSYNTLQLNERRGYE